jgi:hypothetical protein
MWGKPPIVGPHQQKAIIKMEAEIDQIKAILSANTFHWAIKQLLPNESIDNRQYSDFISVTAEDIYQYVKTNGFPAPTIE